MFLALKANFVTWQKFQTQLYLRLNAAICVPTKLNLILKPWKEQSNTTFHFLCLFMLLRVELTKRLGFLFLFQPCQHKDEISKSFGKGQFFKTNLSSNTFAVFVSMETSELPVKGCKNLTFTWTCMEVSCCKFLIHWVCANTKSTP